MKGACLELAFKEPLRHRGVFKHADGPISINDCGNHASSAARLNRPQLTGYVVIMCVCVCLHKCCKQATFLLPR